MNFLTKEYVENNVSNSEIIFKRGENIFHLGCYTLHEADFDKNKFNYLIDGSYGYYNINIEIKNDKIDTKCTCPFPYKGCKHTVAALLDIININNLKQKKSINANEEYLTPEEIKKEALAGRLKRAKQEKFEIIFGETTKGEHIIKKEKSRDYILTIHDPIKKTGHCTCPDFFCNHLNTCKHLISFFEKITNNSNYIEQVKNEKFPFIHFYWDSTILKPRCFYEEDSIEKELLKIIKNNFNDKGVYKKDNLTDLYNLFEESKEVGFIKIDEHLLKKIDSSFYKIEVEKIKSNYQIDYEKIKAALYPYQEKGIEFGLFKKTVIIADEMGLGKTLQAITLALLKKDIYNFKKVLIISPASLKEQWRREIEKFTDEDAVIITGGFKKRKEIYLNNDNYFKITNYEAVMRDNLVISEFKPDLIILDEAQRIKNFNTKTHKAINLIPHKESIILTGTPLENKLEDLYAIVQFADPELLSPLWLFASEHYLISKNKKNTILGYKNLDSLHNKLKSIIIRRKKEEVLDNLPEQVTNNYYLDLSPEQRDIHDSFVFSLVSLLNKKILTPMDIEKIHRILLCMRRVCDSTYLIDSKTNISPKLTELEKILQELIIDNNRKVVIFTEWTSMTFLIGKLLSNMKIQFVEFTGKVATEKRTKLINEFMENKDCKVFLSTDAGGLGLNLQNADAIINFELPWNPAKLNQRIGRIIRIGQKSQSVNIINLITKDSIEENVAAGIGMKQELFDAAIEGKHDKVMFDPEKKRKFINSLREMFNEELIKEYRKEKIQEELDENTPFFLNPKVLEEETQELDLSKEEETISDVSDSIGTDEKLNNEKAINDKINKAEKTKEILENGLLFLNSLMQAASNNTMSIEKEKSTIAVDEKTGEITLKFKFPEF